MQADRDQQCRPVAPGIFRATSGGQGLELVGGFCPACHRYYFPRPPRCPYCLGQVEGKALGATGTLYTYTVVRVRPPYGLPSPYAIGYVDLDDNGLRVLALLAPESLDKLEIGMRLRLAVGQLGCDVGGAPCLRPYFEPAAPKPSQGMQPDA